MESMEKLEILTENLKKEWQDMVDELLPSKFIYQLEKFELL